MDTLDFNLRPEDGWVMVAASPAYIRIQPSSFHPWRLAIVPPSEVPATVAPATGTATFGSNATDGDTLVIGGRVYEFAAVPDAEDEIQIGANAEETIDNAAAYISNGNVAFDADPHVSVVASKTAANVLTIMARTAGSAGNAITLAETGDTITLSGTTLGGGADDLRGMTFQPGRTAPSSFTMVEITGDVFIRTDTSVIDASGVHFAVLVKPGS